MRAEMRTVNAPFRVAVLLLCFSLSIDCWAVVNAPSVSTERGSVYLEWESNPDWYLQYSNNGIFNGSWKRLAGTESGSDASVPLLEDQYFFRLIEGTPFFEVTLPIAGGTVSLDNGVSLTVPEGAWHSVESGAEDLNIQVRLLEPVEADSIIRNTGILNKVFLGGVEIRLVDDLTLSWNHPVVVKLPTLEPLGNRTLPLAATLSLEHGIFNLNPTDLTYDFDTETVEMHIQEILPTAPEEDYREYQDSLIYCVVGVNPDPVTAETLGSDGESFFKTKATIRDDNPILPPDHPCRTGAFNIAEGSLDYEDSTGCQYAIIIGSVVWLQCGNSPIYESYEIRELESKYIKAQVNTPNLYEGETSILLVNLVHSKGKKVSGGDFIFESLTPDIVEVVDPESGTIKGKSCGMGQVRILGPCNLNKTVEVQVESKVTEVIVSKTEILLDFEESVTLDVTLKDFEGNEVTDESFTISPKETNIYNVEKLKDFARVDAKRRGGTREFFITAGCKDAEGNQPTSEPILVEVVEPDLSIQPTNVLLGIGESVEIRVSLLGKNDTPLPQEDINWSSTFGRSCSFDETSYTLTALDKGAGVLTAEYKGVEAKCSVQVTGDLVLNPTEANIHVGEALDIEVLMFDANGNQLPVADQLKAIQWNVSPEGIISFDAGTLKATGLKIGTADLTASIGQQSFTSTINVIPPSIRIHWSGSHSGSASLEFDSGDMSGSGSTGSTGYWSGRIELTSIDGAYVLTSSSMSGAQSGHHDYYWISYGDGGYYNSESGTESMSAIVLEDPMNYASSIENWANSIDFDAGEILNPLFYISAPTARYTHSVSTEWAWTGGSDSSTGSESWDDYLGAGGVLGGVTGLGFLTGLPEETYLQGSLGEGAFSGVFSLRDSFGIYLASHPTPFNFRIHLEVFVFVDK